MSRAHIITVAILVAACSRSRRTPDDKIVVVIEAAMTTADSRFTINNHDSKLSRLVGAGITAVDTPTLEPRLDLASKIEPAEVTLPLPFITLVPVQIGKTVMLQRYITVIPVVHPAWDVTIRDDAKFSDGAPVLGADIEFTYESVLDTTTSSLHSKAFSERFWSVTATGPRTVRITLKVTRSVLPASTK